MVPTGQCVIKKRGGEVMPCAMASKSRSMILSPKAPPMPARNERRANRYDLCNLASGTLGESLGQRDRTHEGGERLVRFGETVGDGLGGAAGAADARFGQRVGQQLATDARREGARVGQSL